MRWIRVVPCLMLAVLLASCGDEPVTPTESAVPSLSLAGNSGPSANGQAILPLDLYPGYEGLITSSFHAREKQDGSVSGSFEAKSRGQDVELHARLDCLVVNGNEATLGGVFTQVRKGPGWPMEFGDVCVGDRIWFKVRRDNGEGSGSDPDQFTDVWWEACGLVTETVCGPYPIVEFPNLIPDLVDIERGNVQVKQ